jgi:hypothetical protein
MFPFDAATVSAGPSDTAPLALYSQPPGAAITLTCFLARLKHILHDIIAKALYYHANLAWVVMQNREDCAFGTLIQ